MGSVWRYDQSFGSGCNHLLFAFHSGRAKNRAIGHLFVFEQCSIFGVSFWMLSNKAMKNKDKEKLKRDRTMYLQCSFHWWMDLRLAPQPNVQQKTHLPGICSWTARQKQQNNLCGTAYQSTWSCRRARWNAQETFFSPIASAVAAVAAGVNEQAQGGFRVFLERL